MGTATQEARIWAATGWAFVEGTVDFKPGEDLEVPSSPFTPELSSDRKDAHLPEPELLPFGGKKHPAATLGHHLMNLL